ncbi:MAG TPA: ADP-ribosylglycohydrolase family protein, partial [Aeromicrobium sp.]|nr:ADP-ribosylglycohydrolase family protein [Aeromicrobium sp.]
DRAAGALVGLAAGDALGAGYEFESVVPDPPRMIGGGLGGWDPGEWTDDTQMAVCIAEVTASGSVDLAAIGGQFLYWYGGHPPDVGNQTRAVLGAYRSGDDLTAIAAAHYERNPRNAAGNGSLMRTAPVALAHLGDDQAIAGAAMAVSVLTHGDPLAGEACVLWCIAIDRAVREGRLDGVTDGLDLLPAPARDRWTRLLEVAETTEPESFTANGFVVTALQAAYSAIVHTPIPNDDMPCVHLQRSLERAVRIGNDTDTVAAIAGQLLGARWGASAVPIKWRAMLHGWPGYRSRDLSRLAILTARGGEPDAATGWPGAEHLVPFYRERDGASGRIVALPDDPGVRIGDAASVSEASGSDVVLSLCRMGWSDVPEGVEHHETWLIDVAGAEHNPNLEFMLRDLASAIAGWRDEGRPVLVHCVRAESRTPTVAAAYLCDRFGLSGSDALARVREVLPGARPNAGFRSALERIWP